MSNVAVTFNGRETFTFRDEKGNRIIKRKGTNGFILSPSVENW